VQEFITSKHFSAAATSRTYRILRRGKKSDAEKAGLEVVVTAMVS
jgi:hypothetical protein